MRDAIRVGVVGVAVIAALGSATPYQAKGFRGGYEETRLGPDQWAVHVEANGYTSESTAVSYAQRRAAELCPGGFDVLDGHSSVSTSFAVNNGNVSYVEKPGANLMVRCRGASIGEPAEQWCIGTAGRCASSKAECERIAATNVQNNETCARR